MTPAVLPVPASRAPRILPWLLGLLLVLGCIAIYRRVAGFDFVAFDDDYNLLFNPHMGPLTLGRVQWAIGDWTYARRCMPLGWLGFFSVFSLSGLNPAGYHLANLGLHAVNSLLFFAVLCQLAEASFPGINPAARNWNAVCAFLGAVFWAWHPLRVESVAWSSGLLYGQSEFFLLLALVVFLRAPQAPPARLGALLAYGLSLLSYPVAIGFAPVFALVAAWRMKNWRRGLWIALPFILVAVAATAANLVARRSSDTMFTPMATLAEFPLTARAMQAAYSWVYYVRIPFWPVALTPVNPVLVDFNPWSAPFILSAGVLMALTAASVAWPAARRTIGPFWLAHLCVLTPLIGLVEPVYFPSDRYAAFPQALLAAALVMALVRLRAASWQVTVLAAGLAVGGIMGLLSARQAEIWRDTPTLFRRIAKGLTPAVSPAIYFQTPATVLYRNGDAPGALAVLDRGVALLPGNLALRAARADLQRQWSDLQACLVSVAAPPSTPPVTFMHQQLGLEAARVGDLLAAEEHLRLAHDSAPDFYAPTYNLALIQLRRGETRAALGSYLWTEAHGGTHVPIQSRAWALGVIADQFAATGETRLAAAARARVLSARRE